MGAGQVDTHGGNDLLVFWDTFNKSKSYIGQGIRVWNRGVLVCPNNKTNNTHDSYGHDHSRLEARSTVRWYADRAVCLAQLLPR
jgi:hypothetical protein